MHAGGVALAHPHPGVPAVGLDLAEGPAVHVHPGAAGLVMVEAHPAAVAVALPQIRPALGQDVGVQVDLQRRGGRHLGQRINFFFRD